MSEQIEGQVQDKQEPAQESKVNTDDLISRLDKLEASNDKLQSSNSRLLDESKTWKSKYQGMKSEAEQQENQKLEQDEDWKGLYHRQTEKVDAALKDAEDAKKSQLKSTLRYEIAKHAKDAHDTDLILKAVVDSKGIAYNKEDGIFEGVEDSVNEIRQNKPFLFDQKKIAMISGRPGAVPEEKPREVDDMSSGEIVSSLKDDFAALFSDKSRYPRV